MNKKVLKIGGIAGIIVGAAALYFGGGTEGEAVSIIGIAFTAIGLIANILSSKE